MHLYQKQSLSKSNGQKTILMKTCFYQPAFSLPNIHGNPNLSLEGLSKFINFILRFIRVLLFLTPLRDAHLLLQFEAFKTVQFAVQEGRDSTRESFLLVPSLSSKGWNVRRREWHILLVIERHVSEAETEFSTLLQYKLGKPFKAVVDSLALFEVEGTQAQMTTIWHAHHDHDGHEHSHSLEDLSVKAMQSDESTDISEDLAARKMEGELSQSDNFCYGCSKQLYGKKPSSVHYMKCDFTLMICIGYLLLLCVPNLFWMFNNFNWCMEYGMNI